MDDDLVVGVVCSECGLDPFDVKSEADEAGGYRLRVRRRALWVWLLVLFVLGVIGSPWVQVRLGNARAINSHGPYLSLDMGYVPLVNPPLRWRDLDRAANGDSDAIKRFRDEVIVLEDSYDSMYWRGSSDFSFQIGKPKEYRGPQYSAPADSEYYVYEGERFLYTLWSYEQTKIGWPIPWWSSEEYARCGYGDERFADDGLLSIEEHTTRVYEPGVNRTYWSSMLFLVVLIVCVGRVVFWLCVWRGVCLGRSRWAGLGVAIVLVVTLGVFGSRHEVVYGNGYLNGNFVPLVPLSQRILNLDELRAQFESESSTMLFAQQLIEDFGQMTHPNDLVMVGLRRGEGIKYDDFSFGIEGYGLGGVGRETRMRIEDDGSLKAVPISGFDQTGWFSVEYGTARLASWLSKDKTTRTSIGLNYRSVTLACVAMYVLWKVMVLVGSLWYRRVQKRRGGRGACVWCGYPCG